MKQQAMDSTNIQIGRIQIQTEFCTNLMLMINEGNFAPKIGVNGIVGKTQRQEEIRLLRRELLKLSKMYEVE